MSKILLLIIFLTGLNPIANAQTAYRFNGTSTSFASITRTGTGVLKDFSTPHDFTLEIRFKFYSTTRATVVSMHSDPANGFFLEFVPTTTTLMAGMGFNGNFVKQTSSSLVQGTWYTAALVYNRTANSFSYYIDGTLVVPTGTLPSAYFPEKVYAIAIAKSLRWGGPSTIDVDFFRIWTNQQTQTQLTTNRTSEVACNSTNLLLQYRFDYPSGSTIMTDCTANLNNGTISGVVIPVELVSFSGQNTEGGNLLTWETASEVNNKGFEVERLNGNDWTALGFVSSNNKASNYQFIDEKTTTTHYYRLRQMDNDGKETLSKVIAIQGKPAEGKLGVYPNPVSNILTIKTEAKADDFQIINLLGQQILRGPLSRRGIDVSALPQGSYILKVGLQQAKFMKQ